MFNILDSEGFFNDMIRDIFAAINKGIYSLIAVTYNLIEDLSKMSILSYGNMQEFARRIYALLGLFMLFKVSFSIITYIVDPNKMTDKTAGFSAIIKNTVITLILILVVPTGFSLLYEAQDAILSENVIPKLILGTDKDISTTGNTKDELKIYFSPDYCGDVPIYAKDTGHYISLLTFRTFFQPNPKYDIQSFADSIGSKIYTRYCFPRSTEYLPDDVNLDLGSIKWDVVKGAISTAIFPMFQPLKQAISGAKKLYNLSQMPDDLNELNTDIQVYDYLNYSQLYNASSAKADHDAIDFFTLSYYDYDIDFNYFIALLVGIIVELVLIGICMDVAVRSVKLTFLQLMAPIPIVSYIDPKSGKDGMFKRWYQEVFKTWGSLFIKLIAVFFGVYLIQQLDTLYLLSGSATDIKSTKLWIMLFLLIGILIFMKQLPTLLESLIPGLKNAGSFTLNPFKKFSNEAIGGKQILGAAGAVGAGALALTGAGIAHGVARRQFRKGLDKSKGEISNSRTELSNLRNQRIANANSIRSNNAQVRGINAQKSALEARKATVSPASRGWDMLENAIKNLDNQKASLQADNARIRAASQSIKGEMSLKNTEIQGKIEKLNDKIEKSKLTKHPIAGAMGSISRGALYGMREGYKNPRNFIKNAITATTQASQNRSHRDKYDLRDRVRERLTDIADIKNSSGTSSIVKEDLKNARNSLTNVTNNIDRLNKTIADLASRIGEAEFNKAVIYQDNGRMRFNDRYTGPSMDDLKAALDNMNTQMDSKIQFEKQIKEYENIIQSGKKE